MYGFPLITSYTQLLRNPATLPNPAASLAYRPNAHKVFCASTQFFELMKKKYPVAFVVLSQLNRNIDNPERQRDGEYGNYVLDSDIYGSDALLQHADVVMGINKPSIRKIRQYGPERFIINDEDMLVFHFLKSRNGTTRISFFKLDRSTMRIVEIDTPAQATKKIAI